MAIYSADEPGRWHCRASLATIEDRDTGDLYDLVAVPADGNCFYTALCGALGLPHARHRHLRRHVAQILIRYADTILQDICADLMTSEQYFADVRNVVAVPRRWDCPLGDMLPLIVARYVLRRSVRIVLPDNKVMLLLTVDDDCHTPPLVLHLCSSHFSYYRRRRAVKRRRPCT